MRATAYRAYRAAVGVTSVARFSTGTFELGKVICVATHSGDWHWKCTPLERYSIASD